MARRSTLLIAICSALAPAAALAAAPAGLEIEKTPVHVAHRIFDPARPPRNMPKLKPPEAAITGGDSRINVSVGGTTRELGARRIELTVTSISIELALDITVWLPKDAPRRIVDHEEGHRRISEHYYEHAENLARRIAEPYFRKTIAITGRNPRGRVRDALGKISTEITAEYSRKMPIAAAQDRYDEITGHSLKSIAVDAAIAQALKEVGGRSR